jgi:hypothetical protein
VSWAVRGPERLRCGEPRATARYMTVPAIPATLSRTDVSIVNLSLSGACLRHSLSVSRNEMRLRFTWSDGEFDEQVAMESSRLTHLGAKGAVSFETRVRFHNLSRASSAALERAVATLHDARLLDWLSSLRDPALREPAWENGVATGFVICTLVDDRWQRRHASAVPAAPPDGFVVSATVPEPKISQLCELFAQLDADGRQLLELLVPEFHGTTGV